MLYQQNGQLRFRGYSSSVTQTNIHSTNNLSATTWHHIAISRSGTTGRLFIDGALEASGTLGNSEAPMNSTGVLEIGAYENSGTYYQYMNGYIQDLRITKGLARYTSAFTPPSSSLEG